MESDDNTHYLLQQKKERKTLAFRMEQISPECINKIVCRAKSPRSSIHKDTPEFVRLKCNSNYVH